MDLTFGTEELAFQQEVRSWLKENLTPEIMGESKVARNAYMPRERLLDWQKRLAKKGWLCTGWPKEFGGPGFTTTQKYIFEMEMAKAGAPGTSPFGPKMCAPVIMKYGSAEQKARHLPPMLNSDLLWCQGYSEPGSGSDLASLRTKAELHGDHYIVNGQKTWTTLAQTADWIFCLVRTSNDGKRQEGISFLLIDMKTPGISVEPIITSDGNRAGTQEVNSVFLTDVKVPVENRVGDENDGWRVAMVTFSFERGTAFISEQLAAMRKLKELAHVARSVPKGNATAWDDGEVRREIGRLQAELDALWALTKRNVSQATRTGVPGPGGSVFKLFYADVHKRMTALSHKILGRHTLAMEDLGDLSTVDFVGDRVYSLTLSIAAGTSQIQRNIVGERILGLPKER